MRFPQLLVVAGHVDLPRRAVNMPNKQLRSMVHCVGLGWHCGAFPGVIRGVDLGMILFLDLYYGFATIQFAHLKRILNVISRNGKSHDQNYG